MNKIIESALQDYCSKQIKKEVEGFHAIYLVINLMKKENETKGYKSGKLYFDVLKKYDLKEIYHNTIIHGAYRAATGKEDYYDIEESILENSERSYYNPDQIYFTLANNFLNFTKKESHKNKAPIPVEELKNFLISFKNSNEVKEDEKELINLIIENDPKNFIIEAIEGITIEFDLPDSKKEELKKRVEASF